MHAYTYMYLVNVEIKHTVSLLFSLHFVQGGSVATSQSAETGSSTAMMDVDSMTSQVSYTVQHNTNWWWFNYTCLFLHTEFEFTGLDTLLCFVYVILAQLSELLRCLGSSVHW